MHMGGGNNIEANRPGRVGEGLVPMVFYHSLEAMLLTDAISKTKHPFGVASVIMAPWGQLAISTLKGSMLLWFHPQEFFNNVAWTREMEEDYHRRMLYGLFVDNKAFRR